MTWNIFWGIHKVGNPWSGNVSLTMDIEWPIQWNLMKGQEFSSVAYVLEICFGCWACWLDLPLRTHDSILPVISNEVLVCICQMWTFPSHFWACVWANSTTLNYPTKSRDWKGHSVASHFTKEGDLQDELRAGSFEWLSFAATILPIMIPNWVSLTNVNDNVKVNGIKRYFPGKSWLSINLMIPSQAFHEFEYWSWECIKFENAHSVIPYHWKVLNWISL